MFSQLSSPALRRPTTTWVRLALIVLLTTMASGCSTRKTVTPLPSSAESDKVVWTFEQVERGAIVSSPLVAGDRLYVGAIRDAGLSTSGAVYCLNREKIGRASCRERV